MLVLERAARGDLFKVHRALPGCRMNEEQVSGNATEAPRGRGWRGGGLGVKGEVGESRRGE